MSEWKIYKLGDLGFFFGGVTTISKEDYGHGTPFLPYKNVYKNSKVNVNELELMNVRPQDVEKRSAVYGDIFFTASSETPDEVAMSSVLLDDIENLTFNGFCKRYRLNNFDTLLPEYARYLFRDVSFRREVYQVATGDIRFNISQESLANIEIEIPNLATQSQIAQILTSLDDKIELNLQMNQTLEAMAQALFKEWFVNFNFPGFDGKLENGLPKGWRMGKLGEILELLYGKALKANTRVSGKYLVIGSSGIVDYHNDFLVEAPGIVIGRKGTIGEVIWIDENFFPIDTTFYVRDLLGVDGLYFHYFLLKKQEFKKITSDSAVPGLNRNQAMDNVVTIPDIEIIKNFNSIIQPLFLKKEINSTQIQTLTLTRDTLLPKLMSGKIEINI